MGLCKKILLSFLTVTMFACSTPENTSSTYSRAEMQTAQRTIKAEIVSKRSVKVKGGTGVGAASGAAAGGIAGSTIGSSAEDNAIGAIAGVLVGATVGAAIENQAQEVDAIEYIIESDVTGFLTIVMTDSSFPKGALVYVSLGSPPKILGIAN